jgi:hypothetical protein
MSASEQQNGMDPDAAQVIAFALEVAQDEIKRLIADAGEEGMADACARLARHRDELAQIRQGFSATSQNLRDLAERTAAIAADIGEIERRLEVDENSESIHCILAAGYLESEANTAAEGGSGGAD